MELYIKNQAGLEEAFVTFDRDGEIATLEAYSSISDDYEPIDLALALSSRSGLLRHAQKLVDEYLRDYRPSEYDDYDYDQWKDTQFEATDEEKTA